MKKLLKELVLALVVLPPLVYGVDYGSVKWRQAAKANLFGDMRVDHLYTSTNKWNEVEWSRGNPTTERCVYALLPHFGYAPCWYLKRHPIQVTNTD
jgi:hypothetical protein